MAVMSQRLNISSIRAIIVKSRYSHPVTSNICSFNHSKDAAPMVPKTRVLESSSKNRTLWDATKSLCLFTLCIIDINQDIFPCMIHVIVGSLKSK